MPRVPLSRRLIRLHQRDAVVKLRLVGQPFRAISDAVGLSENVCCKLFTSYYRASKAKLDVTHAQRKAERRDQLEMVDGLIMRVVVDSSNATARAAAGYTVKDFLAAAETARRYKLDLTRLDGLEGSAAAAGTGEAMPMMDDLEKDSIIAHRFIERLAPHYPELYEHFNRTFPGLNVVASNDAGGEPDDQSRRDPGRDEEAGRGEAEAGTPADPGLGEAGEV